MRPCIQNGLGPSKMHQVIRELHLLNHDEKEFAYLDALHNRKTSQFFFWQQQEV
jgi:hypothetical protein